METSPKLNNWIFVLKKGFCLIIVFIRDLVMHLLLCCSSCVVSIEILLISSVLVGPWQTGLTTDLSSQPRLPICGEVLLSRPRTSRGRIHKVTDIDDSQPLSKITFPERFLWHVYSWSSCISYRKPWILNFSAMLLFCIMLDNSRPF